MIKILTDKTFGFDHPTEKNPKYPSLPLRKIAKNDGNFHELPEWVADTDLFKMGVADGSIHAFRDNKDSEKIGKLYEEELLIKERIRKLKEEEAVLAEQTAERREIEKENKPKRKSRKQAAKTIILKDDNYPAEGDIMPEKPASLELGMPGTSPLPETKEVENLIEEG